MASPRKQSPHYAPWHIDCRLSRELPDDNLVRRHFILQFLAALVCAGLAGYAAWQLYQRHTLEQGIAFWTRTLADNRVQADEIRESRRQLAADAARIDQAYTLLGAPLTLSALLTELGTTRPEHIVIDSFQSGATGVTLRGVLQASPEEASRLLGDYVTQLRNDPALSGRFGQITLTSMDRQDSARRFGFEVALRYRSP